jgi:exopolyphosphatase / guanosine-5'-triphosphate,3'-diphosphate pyrophosphatase
MVRGLVLLNKTSSEKADGKKRPGRTLWEDRSRVGLIDVGSNTVRLVVFDLDGRLPQPVFNERAFCGLGDHLGTTGKLSDESQHLARETIHRFSSLAKQLKVDHLDIFATSAIRDATNGQDLIDAVYGETKRKMRVLSGEQEAQHSGMGVLAGIPDASGLVGDLGGGSLELASVCKRRIGQTCSLPLGTLRLLDMFPDRMDDAIPYIDEELAKVPWLADMKERPLYAVGGTWRSLSKYHLITTGYPLRILHQYEVDGKAALNFATKVFKANDPDAAKAAGIGRKRVKSLSIAALVMQRLLRVTSSDKLVVSALGLREGILYDNAQRDMRIKDPLIEFCKDTARRQSRFPEHAAELRRWTSPLFEEEDDEQARLRSAICLLSDIGWTGHPEYRAEFALEQIMQRQILGISHADRAFIALGLFAVNGGKGKTPNVTLASGMLSKERATLANQIGLSLRLGQRISGGTKMLLGRCALKIEGAQVVLHVPARYDYLVGESVETRLKVLAKALNLESCVRYDD